MRGGGGLENECWRCEFLGLFEVILPQKIMKSRGSEVSIYPALRTQARFFLYKLSMCWKKAQAGKNVKNTKSFPQVLSNFCETLSLSKASLIQTVVLSGECLYV